MIVMDRNRKPTCGIDSKSSGWHVIKTFFLYECGMMLGIIGASLVAQMVKNLPGMRETGFDPWWGRSPGEENGYPFNEYNSSLRLP